MPIRSNPLRSALERGETQVGTWLQMERNPAILPLLKSAGIDFVRFEMEHASASIETVADMALLARALDLAFFVRPPSASREWITRLLDAGVWGFQIPQVDTPEIARAVVQAARYAPAGLRGMAGLGPHADFEPSSVMAEQMRILNEQVHITVMFESAESFRNLDSIVSTPGIDAVTLGPTDLAQDLGVLGEPNQAKVIEEHRERLFEAARRHRKEPVFTVHSVEDARRWINRGVRMLAYASDVTILHRGFSAFRDQLGEQSKK